MNNYISTRVNIRNMFTSKK